MKPLGNVRYQIALILLLAIVPLAALAVYMAVDEGRNDAARAQADSKATVLQVAQDLNRVLQASSDLVVGLSRYTALRESARACETQLASLTPAFPQIANMFLLDGDANVRCAASNPRHVRSLRDRPQINALIDRVRRTRRTAFGQFVLTNVQKRVVPVMGPVFDERQQVVSFLSVTLDLDRLDDLVNTIQLRPEATLVVMDGNGAEVARNPRSPDWPAGTPAPPLERTLVGREDFDREIRGYDGINRFYSVARVRPDANLLVIMKMRASEIYRPARRRLVWHLSGLGAVGLLVLGLTWFGSDRYFRQPLSRLIGTADQLASGNPGARSELDYRGEIGVLAQAVDQMADTLERNQARERQAAAQEAARLRRLKQLAEISMLLAGDPAAVFERIVRMLGELFEVRGVCLSQVDGLNLIFKSIYAEGEVISNAGGCPIGITPCATVRTARTIRIYEPVLDLFPEALFLRHHNAYSWCGFPSLDNEGNVVAVTCLVDDKPREYSEEDQQILLVIGQRIATEFAHVSSMAEHVRMEETLRENERRLEEAQQMAQLGSYTADGASGVMTWSREMYRIFEIDPARGAPTSGDVLERTHPEDRTLVQNNHKELVARDGPYEIEHRLLMADGRIKYVLVRGTVSPDAAGHPYQRGTVQDITERKIIEEEKSKLQVQLNQAQKMESIGRLAGGISHDFNNLLTVINGYSDVLLQQLQGPPRKYVQQIHKAGESAAALTRQLLAFSRMEVTDPRPVLLNDIVAESRDMLERLVGEHIEVKTDLQASADWVLADANQLQQCLMNLVVNAHDAMPAGGLLTIETANVQIEQQDLPAASHVRAGAHVRLTVADTGVGMDEETIQRVFEPFFTTKEKGRGTGLGLSTVYGIVTQWHGFVKVTSQPGSGSVFSIYLPLNQAFTSTGNPKTARRIESNMDAGTLIVVEDQDIVREFVAETLRMSGYAVLEARNGPEALRILEQEKCAIHLMMTDVLMPGMRGRELAARAHVLCPSMKVLFMTGYADGSIDDLDGRIGSNEVILKPFSPEALETRVRELLHPAGVISGPNHPPGRS